VLVISHRGNLAGPSKWENEPGYVRDALAAGFGVEIDLWQVDDEWFLGHDRPDYRINPEELDQSNVFIHLKTPHLPPLHRADAFAIERDPYVLTLRGLLWTNYGCEVGPRSVACAPDLVGAAQGLGEFLATCRDAMGICTDYAEQARQLLDQFAHESRPSVAAMSMEGPIR
jgi:hypothetical protein